MTKKKKQVKLTVTRDRTRKGAEVTDINQCYRISCYQTLSASAKIVFRQRCYELMRNNDLWWVDLPELARYAWTAVEWEEESQRLREEGSVLTKTDQAGNDVKYANPRVKIVRDYNNDLNVIEGHFGFTPFSRKQLSMSAKNTDDPIQAFFAQGLTPDEQ